MAVRVRWRHFRDKEIAGSINSHLTWILKAGGEATFRSIGAESEDRPADSGVRHCHIRDKEIAGSVKGQVNRITQAGNERALHSFGCELKEAQPIIQAKISPKVAYE